MAVRDNIPGKGEMTEIFYFHDWSNECIIKWNCHISLLFGGILEGFASFNFLRRGQLIRTDEGPSI